MYIKIGTADSDSARNNTVNSKPDLYHFSQFPKNISLFGLPTDDG